VSGYHAPIEHLTAVHTIDDVVDALTWIVDDARARGDRLGYFAALYRRTTLRVRDAHHAGRFDDPAWVERLDVVFAVRYLEAYVAHRHGAPTTAAWTHAFARAAEPHHLVLQHLLMGMAAHILLDLGVATVGAEPAALARRRADFRRIDAVLAHMLDDVQEDLNRVSPAMAWLDRAGGRWDEALAEAALVRWRATAWRRAAGLARTAVDERPARIGRIDRSTTAVARRLCPMPGGLGATVWARASAWALATEDVAVADVIDAIR
jgi:hypothetical protein